MTARRRRLLLADARGRLLDTGRRLLDGRLCAAGRLAVGIVAVHAIVVSTIRRAVWLALIGLTRIGLSLIRLALIRLALIRLARICLSPVWRWLIWRELLIGRRPVIRGGIVCRLTIGGLAVRRLAVGGGCAIIGPVDRSGATQRAGIGRCIAGAAITTSTRFTSRRCGVNPGAIDVEPAASHSPAGGAAFADRHGPQRRTGIAADLIGIWTGAIAVVAVVIDDRGIVDHRGRSEEHTSELQSP